jgi:hypothetical protein
MNSRANAAEDSASKTEAVRAKHERSNEQGRKTHTVLVKLWHRYWKAILTEVHRPFSALLSIAFLPASAPVSAQEKRCEEADSTDVMTSIIECGEPGHTQHTI